MLFTMRYMSLSSFCLSRLISSCWASAPPLIKARHFTQFYAAIASTNPAIPSFWPCNDAQITQINQAIIQAHQMAQVAAAALNVAGSERSVSYCTWFGQGMPYIFYFIYNILKVFKKMPT